MDIYCNCFKFTLYECCVLGVILC